MSQNPQRLRLLLYLEWSLLAIMVIGERAQGFELWPRFPLWNIVGVLIFGWMGLRLPKGRLKQFLYVSLEILLLLVTSLVGGLRLIGLWLVIIVVRNSQFLRRPYRLVVTAIAFGLFTMLQFHRRSVLSHILWINLPQEELQRLWVGVMLSYGLILVLLQILLDSLLSEYHNRHQLSVANSKIRQYASQIEELATSQERNRIAQEIHDALGHSLTALTVHLEAVDKLWPVNSTQAQDLLKEARQLASTALQDVRQSVSALRSDPFADQSLAEAIDLLLEEIRRTQTIEIRTDISIRQVIPSPIKIAVYRIMQEALTNILKHSEASILELQVTAETHLQVCIQDNGNGFALSQNTTGFGLQSMKERALALNGSFDIITTPNQGCTIQLSFPLENAPSYLDVQ